MTAELQAPGLPPAGTTVRSRGRTIGEADITLFSALTGDWHPQHSNAVWSADSPFGERIAHGLLVLSIGAGLLAWDPERVVALRALRDVVFKRPVRIGDTLEVEAEVVATRRLDGELGLVTMALRVRNQAGVAAVRARLDLLWRIEAEPEGGRRAA
jgi:3-hydroxybutyryl-CoA dehydratase